jgi:hypothetical protein
MANERANDAMDDAVGAVRNAARISPRALKAGAKPAPKGGKTKGASKKMSNLSKEATAVMHEKCRIRVRVFIKGGGSGDKDDGLPQKVVAEESGVSAAALSLWLSGKQSSAHVLEKLKSWLLKREMQLKLGHPDAFRPDATVRPSPLDKMALTAPQARGMTMQGGIAPLSIPIMSMSMGGMGMGGMGMSPIAGMGMGGLGMGMPGMGMGMAGMGMGMPGMGMGMPGMSPMTPPIGRAGSKKVTPRGGKKKKKGSKLSPGAKKSTAGGSKKKQNRTAVDADSEHTTSSRKTMDV